MKRKIRLTEGDLHRIVKESVNRVLCEERDEIEDMPTFEVFNKNISMTELDKILNSFVYDKNDNCVGRLSDLHFKYDVAKNTTLGAYDI